MTGKSIRVKNKDAKVKGKDKSVMNDILHANRRTAPLYDHGDEILTDEQRRLFRPMDSKDSTKRSILKTFGKQWTNGIVPYTIATEFCKFKYSPFFFFVRLVSSLRYPTDIRT